MRSYAESLGITVELANEDLPSIWRLREMQTLVSTLRGDPANLVTAEELTKLLSAQRANRWTDLIAEGIASLARELGSASMPALDAVEWLAEWSRETRGDQRNLLLLTAHRAKGLEFDHVVILDGGWGATSRGEDEDAPRRLFYVAMTRARKTLAATTTGEHGFLKPGGSGVLLRQVSIDQKTCAPCRHYELPSLGTVDLSFAGRLGRGHVAHEAIASAEVGDELRLVQEGGGWALYDCHSRPLGRMSKAWKPPAGMMLTKGTVGAVVRWRKIDSDEAYRDWMKRDEWETVLPELEFSTGPVRVGRQVRSKTDP